MSRMRDTFETYHPFVNFVYFSLVITFAMVLKHPVAQGISLFCAIAYALNIEFRKNIGFLVKFCFPMILMTTFINPAFNHEGTTTLLYFSTGNPLTLESILYGFSMGILMTTELLLFSAFSRVMTSDKFIYLFGRVIPALSLVLSMALRFVPKFKKQLDMVVEAQRSIGRDVSYGSLLQRIKMEILIFSIMITWALENAMETADSMKSRGYGLPGRTAFSIYRMEERDRYMLLWFLFCGLYLTAGSIILAFGCRYFPNIRYASIDRSTMSFYFVYFGLCITPVVLNIREEIKWKIIYLKM